jgi:hypothetical protein
MFQIHPRAKTRMSLSNAAGAIGSGFKPPYGILSSITIQDATTCTAICFWDDYPSWVERAHENDHAAPTFEPMGVIGQYPRTEANMVGYLFHFDNETVSTNTVTLLRFIELGKAAIREGTVGPAFLPVSPRSDGLTGDAALEKPVFQYITTSFTLRTKRNSKGFKKYVHRERYAFLDE